MHRIDKLVEALYEQRVKKGTDYSYVYKYGQLQVICCEVFKESILEEARKADVKIDHIFTYELS